MSEIARQLEAMKAGDFTSVEIESARSAIISGLRQINDSPASIEAFEFRRLLADVSEDVESCLNSIMSITPDDVIRAAAKVELDTVYFLDGDGEGEEYDE